MAKKYVDTSGKTPKVKVSLPEARRKILAQDEWFIEYKNTDTRNALTQALELVDHDGDSIFYAGEVVPGFKVSFSQVELLENSLHSGVFKFTAYHKKSGVRVWQKWQGNKKPPQSILNGHIKAGRLKKPAF